MIAAAERITVIGAGYVGLVTAVASQVTGGMSFSSRQEQTAWKR